jgi:pimeloyl-ACP methyl ester carboxylesterase
MHSRLDLMHSRLDLIRTRLDLIHSQLDLIHSRLDLIHAQQNYCGVLQVAGAGHWVHLECKSKFLETLAEFLEMEIPKK